MAFSDDNTDTQLYGYVPTAWLCMLFCVLFGLSTVMHLGKALYFRMWFLLLTAFLCGAAETVGWAFRFWASQNPNADLKTQALNPYIVHHHHVIGPTYLLAGVFVLLGRMIRLLGPEYSRLGPRKYVFIFTGLDVTALFIQCGGGAIASSELSDNKPATTGSNIMLAGIIFQLASIVFYLILSLEFFIRFYLQRPVRDNSGHIASHSPQSSNMTLQDKPAHDPILLRKVRPMVIGMNVIILFLFVRAIYRVVELAAGFAGPIYATEAFFAVFDGLMIIIAMYALNIFHPGWFLRPLMRESTERVGNEKI